MSYFFWTAFCFIAYTYIFYPFLISIFGRLKGAPEPRNVLPEDLPSIDVIVPFNNEKSLVQDKYRSITSLEYPQEKLNMIFVSDGSNDGTEDIIRKLDRVTPIIVSDRKGKPNALNMAVKASKADVLLLTDARQELEPTALKILVSYLLCPNVGAVSGELVLRSKKSGDSTSIGLYWKYEKWIRKNESKYHSTPGVTGAIYVIRRTDFPRLNNDAILDDFEVPASVIRRKKRVLFAENAIAYDQAQNDVSIEKIRKIRTLTGNYQSFLWNPWLFSPLQNPIFWQFISHKAFRLIVPYMLLVAFITPWFIEGNVYTLACITQVTFYALGVAGVLSKKIRNYKIVNFAAVFISLNYSAVIAFRNFLTNKASSQWIRT